MKEFLRQRLSGWQWKILQQIKHFIRKGVLWKFIQRLTIRTTTEIFLLPVRILPTVVQVEIKESLNPVRKMDYKKSVVLMAVNSWWQYYRLNSVKKEPETVKWIEENVTQDDVFYDIGANVGAYSLVTFRATGGRAKIIAFEPGFPTFNEFCKNIILNNAGNSIVPLQIGLGDSDQLINLTYSELSAGAAQHAWEGANNREKDTFSGVAHMLTPCCRLDEIIPFFKLPLPTVIKIDVDGPEYEVLIGARKTLCMERVRTVLIELEDADAEKITAVFTDAGFVVSEKYRRGSTWCNYIFKKQ